MVGARRVNWVLEKGAAVFAGELSRNLWEPRRVVWEDLGYLGFCLVRAARREQKSRRAAKMESQASGRLRKVLPGWIFSSWPPCSKGK